MAIFSEGSAAQFGSPLVPPRWRPAWLGQLLSTPNLRPYLRLIYAKYTTQFWCFFGGATAAGGAGDFDTHFALDVFSFYAPIYAYSTPNLRLIYATVWSTTSLRHNLRLFYA